MKAVDGGRSIAEQSSQDKGWLTAQEHVISGELNAMLAQVLESNGERRLYRAGDNPGTVIVLVDTGYNYEGFMPGLWIDAVRALLPGLPYFEKEIQAGTAGSATIIRGFLELPGIFGSSAEPMRVADALRSNAALYGELAQKKHKADGPVNREQVPLNNRRDSRFFERRVTGEVIFADYDNPRRNSFDYKTYGYLEDASICQRIREALTRGDSVEKICRTILRGYRDPMAIKELDWGPAENSASRKQLQVRLGVEACVLEVKLDEESGAAYPVKIQQEEESGEHAELEDANAELETGGGDVTDAEEDENQEDSGKEEEMAEPGDSLQSAGEEESLPAPEAKPVPYDARSPGEQLRIISEFNLPSVDTRFATGVNARSNSIDDRVWYILRRVEVGTSKVVACEDEVGVMVVMDIDRGVTLKEITLPLRPHDARRKLDEPYNLCTDLYRYLRPSEVTEGELLTTAVKFKDLIPHQVETGDTGHNKSTAWPAHLRGQEPRSDQDLMRGRVYTIKEGEGFPAALRTNVNHVIKRVQEIFPELGHCLIPYKDRLAQMSGMHDQLGKTILKQAGFINACKRIDALLNHHQKLFITCATGIRDSVAVAEAYGCKRKTGFRNRVRHLSLEKELKQRGARLAANGDIVLIEPTNTSDEHKYLLSLLTHVRSPDVAYTQAEKDLYLQLRNQAVCRLWGSSEQFIRAARNRLRHIKPEVLERVLAAVTKDPTWSLRWGLKPYGKYLSGSYIGLQVGMVCLLDCFYEPKHPVIGQVQYVKLICVELTGRRCAALTIARRVRSEDGKDKILEAEGPEDAVIPIGAPRVTPQDILLAAEDLMGKYEVGGRPMHEQIPGLWHKTDGGGSTEKPKSKSRKNKKFRAAKALPPADLEQESQRTPEEEQGEKKAAEARGPYGVGVVRALIFFKCMRVLARQVIVDGGSEFVNGLLVFALQMLGRDLYIARRRSRKNVALAETRIRLRRILRAKTRGNAFLNSLDENTLDMVISEAHDGIPTKALDGKTPEMVTGRWDPEPGPLDEQLPYDLELKMARYAGARARTEMTKELWALAADKQWAFELERIKRMALMEMQPFRFTEQQEVEVINEKIGADVTQKGRYLRHHGTKIVVQFDGKHTESECNIDQVRPVVSQHDLLDIGAILQVRTAEELDRKKEELDQLLEEKLEFSDEGTRYVRARCRLCGRARFLHPKHADYGPTGDKKDAFVCHQTDVVCMTLGDPECLLHGIPIYPRVIQSDTHPERARELMLEEYQAKAEKKNRKVALARAQAGRAAPQAKAGTSRQAVSEEELRLNEEHDLGEDELGSIPGAAEEKLDAFLCALNDDDSRTLAYNLDLPGEVELMVQAMKADQVEGAVQMTTQEAREVYMISGSLDRLHQKLRAIEKQRFAPAPSDTKFRALLPYCIKATLLKDVSLQRGNIRVLETKPAQAAKYDAMYLKPTTDGAVLMLNPGDAILPTETVVVLRFTKQSVQANPGLVEDLNRGIIDFSQHGFDPEILRDLHRVGSAKELDYVRGPLRRLPAARRFAFSEELNNILVLIQLAGMTVGEIGNDTAVCDRTQKPVGCRAIFDAKYLGGTIGLLKVRIVVQGNQLSMLLRVVASATVGRTDLYAALLGAEEFDLAILVSTDIPRAFLAAYGVAPQQRLRIRPPTEMRDCPVMVRCLEDVGWIDGTFMLLNIDLYGSTTAPLSWQRTLEHKLICRGYTQSPVAAAVFRLGARSVAGKKWLMDTTPQLLEQCCGIESDASKGYEEVRRMLLSDVPVYEETDDPVMKQIQEGQKKKDQQDSKAWKAGTVRFKKMRDQYRGFIQTLGHATLVKDLKVCVEEVFAEERGDKPLVLAPAHVDDLMLLVEFRVLFCVLARLVELFRLKRFDFFTQRYCGKIVRQVIQHQRHTISMPDKIRGLSLHELPSGAEGSKEGLSRLARPEEQTLLKGIRGALLWIIGWYLPSLTMPMRGLSVGNDAKKPIGVLKDHNGVVEIVQADPDVELSLFYGFESSAVLNLFDASFQDNSLINPTAESLSLKTLREAWMNKELTDENVDLRAGIVAEGTQRPVKTWLTLLVETQDLEAWLRGEGGEDFYIPVTVTDWGLEIGPGLVGSSYGAEAEACDNALDHAAFTSHKMTFMSGRHRTRVTAGDNKGLISRAARLNCLKESDFKGFKALIRISHAIQTQEEFLGHLSDALNLADPLGKLTAKNAEKFFLLRDACETNLMYLKRSGDTKGSAIPGLGLELNSYEREI